MKLLGLAKINHSDNSWLVPRDSWLVVRYSIFLVQHSIFVSVIPSEVEESIFIRHPERRRKVYSLIAALAKLVPAEAGSRGCLCAIANLKPTCELFRPSGLLVEHRRWSH
jgi:hypothetical protein